MKHEAVITKWSKKKGFGFIQAQGSRKQYFAHISEFNHRPRTKLVGKRVSFRLTKDKNGRDCACEIEVLHSSAKKVINAILWLLGLLLVCGLGFFSYNRYGNNPLPYWYLLLSFVSYYCYAKDKKSAQFDNWRVSEKKLHLLSFLGGWPGAFIAQKWLRHKTIKTSFQRVYWLTVIANCGVVAWAYSSTGKSYISPLWAKFAQGLGSELSLYVNYNLLPQVKTLLYQIWYAF
ncbi:DUF1294 domain-containing protein [Alginatibacterium sediminis]|nr:cold shock and DUF1294 domain-containing protein [Alginatibacterium sediminis]